MRLSILALLLGLLPNHLWGEPAALTLDLPADWYAVTSGEGGDHRFVAYLKRGENLTFYSEIVKREVRQKKPGLTVRSVERKHQRMLGKAGCRFTSLPGGNDPKRSTVWYECGKARRCGALLTVEGGDATIDSVFYELPKPKPEGEDKNRLVAFLREKARICSRSDRSRCFR